jgi:hypothetical protein
MLNQEAIGPTTTGLMGNTLRNWLKFSPSDALGELSHAEWVVYWSIVLIPLWWLLGIQTLLFSLLPFYLFVRGINLDRILTQRLPLCIWMWMVWCVFVLTLALLALADMGLPLGKLFPTLITFLKGYFLIFACLITPFWHRVRMKVLVRAVCWMAFSYVITVGIQVICLYGHLWKAPIYPPLAKLIPGDKLSLLIKPAVFQKFFGLTLPRTSIYMADPPIPGVCGILCYFICRNEANRRIQLLGVFGSIAALIVSQSRLAWVCFPGAILVVSVFWQYIARQVSLWSVTGLSFTSAMLGITIKELINKPMEVFNGARAESSADRALVVGKTLLAWQKKPWFGWGIVQGSVKWYIYDIALGSFSTYAAVLYLQGMVGFGLFMLTLLATVWDFAQLALQKNLDATRGLAACLALFLLLEGLPMTWISVYFWYFYLWLGIILADAADEHPIAPKWEHFAP